MTSDKEKLAIKNIVLNVLDKEQDIISIYISDEKGEIITKDKIARGESRVDAIQLQMITKTRVAIHVGVKVAPKANVPHLYRLLNDELQAQLALIKVNLYSFKLSIVDIEKEYYVRT